MRTIEEAIRDLIAHVFPGAPVDAPLAQVLGAVLACDIVSDDDSPPFAKSMMDGYAVRSADLALSGETCLTVIEEITAGNVPVESVQSGQASRIMTGAPIPQGADAVVPIEQTRGAGDRGAGTGNRGKVTLLVNSIPVGRNIVRQGAAFRRGDRVLTTGTVLTPARLGLLAELGQAHVKVYRQPTVAILATGDELVPIEQAPGPGQIRNSNETMLAAQIQAMGGKSVRLGMARDQMEELRAKIRTGVQSDFLCLSGGVSAGKLDLVPEALRLEGVVEVFHKVNLKPGKPLWFGKLDESSSSDGKPHWVFGLPGNPVSSFVCCALFVRLAVRRFLGRVDALPTSGMARLTVPHEHRDDRPTYHPAHWEWSGTEAIVTPLSWQGSFDLRGPSQANSLMLFPAGPKRFEAGDCLPVVLLDG